MTLPLLPFARLIPSRQLIPGDLINGLVNLLTGTASSITALAGGARSASTPSLSSAFNELTTVATNGDSACLPPAKSGLRVAVLNSGAANAQIFAAVGTTDTIQGTAGAIGVALNSGASAMYVCFKDGVWQRFVTA
jgi:hypothetical protein